ncbi:MAG: alpha/beta hydrolase [Betaproteobacteria bacterium]|nr:alpha/beta hydrolase [Betaproteobacteria bacterium]
MHAKVRGSGEHTLVFGHGFGTDQNCWQAQVATLQRTHRIVTLDFPGAAPHTLEAFDATRHQTLFGFAEDLALLMDELGVAHATYIGHSLGGMIGILASNGTSGVFDTVVTLGSSACFVDDPRTGYVGGFSAQAMDDMLAGMRGDYAAWANGFAPLMVGGSNPYLSGLDFTSHLLKLRPDVAHCVLNAALLADHRVDVDAFRGRLAVLNGQRDPAVPMSAAHWLARHGGADGVVELDVDGHLPHMTAPGLVTSALSRILGRITDD